MTVELAQTIYLSDYQVPEFLIDKTVLKFELEESYSQVTTTLSMRRNPESAVLNSDLSLHGQDQELLSLSLNGKLLSEKSYQVSELFLTIPELPADNFELTLVSRIHPEKNTSLEGLYKSRTMFCTQCEAEGFRKISYYLDRPDVMSEFTTTIIADKTKYPVLLSNGNPIESGELEDGKHFATWHDPFKKPAYLFALVAGELSYVEDFFTTCSQREIQLRIYVEEKDLDKCAHAMNSLKASMHWDEEQYGREYDLDIFNIVAVDDFNMGAMENKGLNIFNTSCVLANPETTTDVGFQRVEAVVAHEYFHNWSGNRVTCRDWFQLSLKEGFTVFRDAEFSADMNSRAVKRIEDVTLLRTLQFAEDSGPMAHPVQPDSYMEINNFYTLTIYEKGAEIVRMLHTLLGAEKFRLGSDLYFQRHDGQAVTIEDFVAAMETVSDRDLSQFKRWYKQAATPVLQLAGVYDENEQTYTLNVKQSCRATAESENKQPYLIPLSFSLLGDAGALPLQLVGQALNTESADNTQLVLEVTETEQQFVFSGVKEAPVPSLLRGFSAPVKLEFSYSNDDLAFIIAKDNDGFNRWSASQNLALTVLFNLLSETDAKSQVKYLALDLLKAFETIIDADNSDPAMLAKMLTLPSEAALHEALLDRGELVDVHRVHQVRKILLEHVAKHLRQAFLAQYQACQNSQAYLPNAEQIGLRSLKNISLSYLLLVQDDIGLDLAQSQFSETDNMTDCMAALSVLVNSGLPAAKSLADKALADFYLRWQHEALVVNQWFSVQAGSELAGGLERCRTLLEHSAFDISNPNKVRAVLGAFTASHINFHRADGEGYRFLADLIIQLNTSNPQLAARLLTPLTKWQRYTLSHQEKMRASLQRIQQCEGLSPDVFEVVNKSLQ